MKIRLVLLAVLLALPLAAEEANPFVKKKPGEKPPVPSGEPFMVVEEQILVAAERLDAWLEKNPLNEDAASLRSAVQPKEENGDLAEWPQMTQTQRHGCSGGSDFGSPCG